MSHPESMSSSDSEVENDVNGSEVPEGAELTIDEGLKNEAKAKIKKANNKKRKKKSEDDVEDEKPGVIYLGHIPFGFFEEQMRGFFSQFGEVGRLRLSRSKKTANSKGYAFIEFKNSDVAEIVAETMDGYILFGRILKCHVMAEEKIHKDIFKGAGQTFKRIPRHRVAAANHNKPRSEHAVEKIQMRLRKKEAGRKRSLEQRGINYSYDGYGGETKKRKTGSQKAQQPEATVDDVKKSKAPKKDSQTPAAKAPKSSKKKSGEPPKPSGKVAPVTPKSAKKTPAKIPKSSKKTPKASKAVVSETPKSTKKTQKSSKTPKSAKGV